MTLRQTRINPSASPASDAAGGGVESGHLSVAPRSSQERRRGEMTSTSSRSRRRRQGGKGQRPGRPLPTWPPNGGRSTAGSGSSSASQHSAERDARQAWIAGAVGLCCRRDPCGAQRATVRSSGRGGDDGSGPQACLHRGDVPGDGACIGGEARILRRRGVGEAIPSTTRKTRTASATRGSSWRPCLARPSSRTGGRSSRTTGPSPRSRSTSSSGRTESRCAPPRG
jgi:hypothetical protein